jgi:hypothetical protein
MPGAIALLSDSMKKAIVGTVVAGVGQDRWGVSAPHRSVFYSTAAMRLLREKLKCFHTSERGCPSPVKRESSSMRTLLLLRFHQTSSGHQTLAREGGARHLDGFFTDPAAMGKPGNAR